MSSHLPSFDHPRAEAEVVRNGPTEALLVGLILTTAFLIEAPAHPVMAQEPRVLQESLRCELEFTDTRELVAVDDHSPISVTTKTAFVTNSRFAFFAPLEARVGLLRRRLGPGEHAEQVVGSEGEGPGEFRRIALWGRALADSLFVYDGELKILEPDGTYARKLSLPFTPFAITWWDETGLLVASARWIRRGVPSSYLVHLLTADGRHVRSFSEGTGIVDPRRLDAQVRIFAEPRRSSLWVGYRTSYRLEEWTADGERVRVLVRSAPWFEPWALRDRQAARTIPPHPILLRVVEREDGLLWVITLQPSPDWTPAPRARESDPRPPFHELYSYRLELIDADAGTVVASALFEDPLLQVTHDTRAIHFRFSELDIPSMLSSSVRLEPPGCLTGSDIQP